MSVSFKSMVYNKGLGRKHQSGSNESSLRLMVKMKGLGRKRDHSCSEGCSLRLVAQNKGLTTTRVTRPPLEIPKTPTKGKSDKCVAGRCSDVTTHHIGYFQRGKRRSVRF